MRRREFIASMGASVTWPVAAMAQQAGRTYRVGGLTASPRNSPPSVAMFCTLTGFRNLRRSWSNLRSMSFMPPEMLFAPLSERRRPFRSSALPGIWSGRGS
jgi:hypothetical protein